MKVASIMHKDLIAVAHENKDNPSAMKKVLFSPTDFDESCGLKMLNWATIQPGDAFTRHYHESLEEVMYILQGTGEMETAPKGKWAERETAVLTAGTAVIIPINTEHAMKNIGQDELLFLAFGASKGEGKTVIV